MQLLKANCPYCSKEVETTVDRIEEPIVCPACQKPFEIEVPTTQVTSVRTVEAGDKGANDALAGSPGEQELFKVHPVAFRARPLKTLLLLVAIAACLFGLWAALLGGLVAGGPFNWLFWLSLAGLVVVVGIGASWMLKSAFTTLTVTDDRTILQEGIIARDTSEVQHDDVRNIQVDQTFLERMLGVGDIGISSSGQDDLEIVAERIPNPARLVEVIRRNQ